MLFAVGRFAFVQYSGWVNAPDLDQNNAIFTTYRYSEAV